MPENTAAPVQPTQPSAPSPVTPPAAVSETAKTLEAEKQKYSDDDVKDILENRTYAAVSYLYLLSLVVYFSKKHSKYATFHAKQGMVLFGLAMIFLATPPFIRIPVELALFAGMVIGCFQAMNGYYYKVPFIYSLTLGKLPEQDIAAAQAKVTAFIKQTKEQIQKSQTPPTPPATPTSGAAPQQ